MAVERFDITRVVSHRDGVPVYGYRGDSAVAPVSVVHIDEPWPVGVDQRHIHEFPALMRNPGTDAVYVVAAGEVIDAAAAPVRDGCVFVTFDPVALDGAGRAPWPAWRAHPLLFPFLHGRRGGLLRLELPPERTALWDSVIGSLETELTQRADGYREAALAYVTLLLIDLARIAADSAGDLRRSGEPLLAAVFDVIGARYDTELSLRDVAAAVGMSPGHLTTVVRRRTGRTVQDWIIERRMAEARRLLAATDLPIGEIARRVGLSDPGYFARLFRTTVGMSPRQWRAADSG
ncbi:transcriptional regulator, AraC family [Nocardia nova SH22a]|uniref:Transcriptional regulator, AraC family n=1 Tax=Nocardia nova SH22a TaxID=1415166 RepID=W5TDK7_9NOCA|nr:AraC family transcriptional regulator [Nocardia nova]AHH17400.1 transcriptional regulator, AraC family [Nocardia nova SH22a]